MTVEGTISEMSYSENGVTDEFPVPFRFLTPSHIKARRTLDDGTEIDLAYGVEYQVTGGETDAGGTLSVTTPTADATLHIYRLTPRKQGTDYKTEDSFPAETHENALDRAMMVAQEVERDTADRDERAVRVPSGEIGFDLAAAAARANLFQSYDALGAPALSSGTGADAGLRSDLAAETPTRGSDLVAHGNGNTLGDAIDAMVGGSGPILIAIAGQSNAAGDNNGGPDPSNDLVHSWDADAGDWVTGGQYTNLPWTLSAPDGNDGNNNYGLGAAHYIAERTQRDVYVLLDATGGTSIDEWTASGTLSARYAALKGKVEDALATPELSGHGALDLLIWAQGEEDQLSDFATYLGKLDTLDDQLRAESWMGDWTRACIMGMSKLHDRYQITAAHRHFCGKSNGKWRYIPTRGLRTTYDNTGSGDFTHFLGPDLFYGGYALVGPAFVAGMFSGEDNEEPLIYGRNSGPATFEDVAVVTSFSTLISWNSRDLGLSGISGPLATGSISWGEQCVAEANYSYALGYESETANDAFYSVVIGRDLLADTGSGYGAAFGFSNTMLANYNFAAGRGHVTADDYGAAVGSFSEYTTPQADEVRFQVGTGGSSSPRNGLAVRQSGRVEMKNLPTSAAGLPSGTLWNNSGVLNIA